MKTLSIIAVIVLLSVSASHARVRHIPIADMPSQADFVIVGEVIDKECYWVKEGVMINTDYVVAVKETLKGDPEPIIFMTFAGGTVNGESVVIAESPRLEVGETYLLFGLENGKSYAPVVGRGQGIFRVLDDKASGKQYIVDYDGDLLEAVDDGKPFRGQPVDTGVKDRLVLRERKAVKESVQVPAPVAYDAEGNLVPESKPISMQRKAVRSGRPLEKSAFINYINGRAKK